MHPSTNPFINKPVPFVVEDISYDCDKPLKTIIVTVKEDNGICQRLSFPAKINDFTSLIQSSLSKAVPLNELKYFDLLFSKEYCNGVYLFLDPQDSLKKQKRYAYIGSSASRAIVERIGGHLALRARDFMNIMVRYVARELSSNNKPDSFSSKDLSSRSVINIIQTFSVLFIPVKNNLADTIIKQVLTPVEKDARRKYIAKVRYLEGSLIKQLEPALQIK